MSALFGLWPVLPSRRDREHNPTTRDQHPARSYRVHRADPAAVGVSLSWQRLRMNSIAAPVLTHTASNAIAYLVAAALARRSGP